MRGVPNMSMVIFCLIGYLAVGAWALGKASSVEYGDLRMSAETKIGIFLLDFLVVRLVVCIAIYLGGTVVS